MKIFQKNRLRLFGLLLWLLLINYSVRAQNDIKTDSIQLVEIDGYKYHVKLAGLQHLKDNTPAIVLELGAGSTIETWNTIFDDLAKVAPIFAYERSGIGESDWNQLEASPKNAITVLHKILTKLEIPPPYVLVGHSWGGVIIRSYAGHYPSEVKALAYIDPTDFNLYLEDFNQIYMNLGVEPEVGNKFFDDIENFYSQEMNMPIGIKAEIDFAANFIKLKNEERNLGSEPSLPTVVFVGSKYSDPPPLPPSIRAPFSDKDWFRASMEQRISSLSKIATSVPEGYFLVYPSASHYFHLDEPEIVIEMITRLVNIK